MAGAGRVRRVGCGSALGGRVLGPARVHAARSRCRRCRLRAPGVYRRPLSVAAVAAPGTTRPRAHSAENKRCASSEGTRKRHSRGFRHCPFANSPGGRRGSRYDFSPPRQCAPRPAAPASTSRVCPHDAPHAATKVARLSISMPALTRLQAARLTLASHRRTAPERPGRVCTCRGPGAGDGAARAYDAAPRKRAGLGGGSGAGKRSQGARRGALGHCQEVDLEPELAQVPLSGTAILPCAQWV